MKIVRILLVVPALIVAAACLFAYAPQPLVREDKAPPVVAKLLFVGDMMFDRTIRAIGDTKGYDSLFSCVGPYLAGFDLVVGNLEGPITLSDSVSVGTKPGQPGNTAFTFSPLAAYALARNNVRMVSLGNNHILDRGEAGVESTRRALEESGVAYFGAPGSDIATTTVVQGETIGLANFNQFLGQGDPEKTVRAIKALRARSAFVAVYAHWGDEYVPATDAEKAMARSFIDAGADIVIGSHPHVIQEKETYAGKPIYYSIGNFIFDQYFDAAVETGMGVEVTLVDGAATPKERLFNIAPGGATCIMQPDGRP